MTDGRCAGCTNQCQGPESPQVTRQDRTGEAEDRKQKGKTFAAVIHTRLNLLAVKKYVKYFPILNIKTRRRTQTLFFPRCLIGATACWESGPSLGLLLGKQA